jgi:hypothetical protein
MESGEFSLQQNFVVQRKVGKLVEVWVRRFDSVLEVNAFRHALYVTFVEGGTPAVQVADFRSTAVFSQDIASSWLEVMRWEHTRLQRAAVLLERGNATFNLQVERLINESGGSGLRHVFYRQSELQQWMSSAMSTQERMRAFEVLTVSPLSKARRTHAA